MKRQVFAVILALLFIFNISAFAKSSNFTFDSPDGFVGAYKDGKKDALANKLGITKQEVESIFDNKGIEYFSISDDRKTQFSISVYSNDLSALTGDTSRLDDEALKSFATSLLEMSTDPYEIYTQNDAVYIVLSSTEESSNGDTYYSSQYITVVGGDFYHLTFITSKPSASDEILDLMSGFEIKAQNKQPIDAVYILLIVFAIAAFTALATVMLVGIIKRLRLQRKERKEQIEQEYQSITEE